MEQYLVDRKCACINGLLVRCHLCPTDLHLFVFSSISVIFRPQLLLNLPNLYMSYFNVHTILIYRNNHVYVFTRY